MNVWTVEFEELWDNDEYFTDGAEWIVVANSYEEALEKAKKLAVRSFKDDDTGETHKVTKVRLTHIRRGTELDA